MRNLVNTFTESVVGQAALVAVVHERADVQKAMLLLGE
jgi:hypothetical protein